MNTLDFNKNLHQARYLMQTNQLGDALKIYATLVKEFPGMTEVWDEYGKAAAASGEYDLASQAWEHILKNNQKNAQLLVDISAQYAKIWQFARATQLSREAAEMDPKSLDTQLNLASLLTRSAGVKDAREVVERCQKLDPKHAQVRFLAAHLDRRDNKLTEAEQQFRDIIASNPRESQVTYFSSLELARILDRMEQFDEAITHLVEAKRVGAKSMDLAKASKRFDDRRERMPRKAREFPKNILKIWGDAFPPADRNAAPPLAFLGGHARSGTTLLERILDAHPAVAAADESLAFMSIGPLIDVTAPTIPANHLNWVRNRYLKNLLKTMVTTSDGKTLVDKNPAVTAYLPALLRVFPELRVIIALRDPRDVLVSCFFEDIIQVSHFSFEKLAQLYTAVMSVWLAVREWEGLVWTETRYESIVANTHVEGSRMTKFLGLEWHENQERFYEQNLQKPILSTNNYSSVTKPVHNQSIGRWRHYERYMKDALPILEPFCKEFGYS